jgi:hypothetical protein
MELEKLLKEVDDNWRLTVTEQNGLKILMRFFVDTRDNGYFERLEKDYFLSTMLIDLGYIKNYNGSKRKYVWLMDKPEIEMLREIHETFQTQKGGLLNTVYFGINSDDVKKQLAKFKKERGFKLKNITKPKTDTQLSLPLTQSNIVTLQDVADDVNLDVSTVSKALNDKPNIKESTKIKVREAAKRLGYIPKNISKRVNPKTTSEVTEPEIVVTEPEIVVTEPETPIQQLNITINEDFVSIFKNLYKELSVNSDVENYIKISEKWNIPIKTLYELKKIAE